MEFPDWVQVKKIYHDHTCREKLLDSHWLTEFIRNIGGKLQISLQGKNLLIHSECKYKKELTINDY